MEVTLFGLMWVFLTIIFFFKNVEYMTIMWILSFIFHAASVVNVGNSCIDVPLYTSIIFIVKCLSINTRVKMLKIDRTLFMICLVAIISIIISASCFTDIVTIRNINVYERKIYYGNVDFGADNITMLIPLLVYSSAFIMLNNIKCRFTRDFPDRAIRFAIVVVLLFGVWQWLETTGVIPPTILRQTIYSNASHWNSLAYGKGNPSYNRRIFSTFSEPSYAGAFLSASFWYLMQKKKKYRFDIILIVLTSMELILNMSGTGIAGLITGGILFYFVTYQGNKRKKIIIIVVVCCLIILLMQTSLVEYLEEYYKMKLRSYSYYERSNYNQAAIRAFIDTYSLGLGYGSLRASGLIQNILGQIGIIGLIFYLLFIFQGYKLLDKKSPFCIFFLCIIGAQVVSCADFTLSTFWLALVLLKLERFNEELKVKCFTKYDIENTLTI